VNNYNPDSERGGGYAMNEVYKFGKNYSDTGIQFRLLSIFNLT
jgi:hypothetical protein